MSASSHPPASATAVADAHGTIFQLRATKYRFFAGTEVDRLLVTLIATIEAEWGIAPILPPDDEGDEPRHGSV